MDVDFKASFVRFPENYTIETRTVTYLDPCDNMVGFNRDQSHMNIGVYEYTGLDFVYRETGMIPDPSFCPVTFTCSLLGYNGADIDGCTIPGISTFDPDLGEFVLNASIEDFSKIHHGPYMLHIKGKTGAQKEWELEKIVNFQMDDLCKKAQIELIDMEYSDMVYKLEDDEQAKAIRVSDMFRVIPPIDCGEGIVHF